MSAPLPPPSLEGFLGGGGDEEGGAPPPGGQAGGGFGCAGAPPPPALAAFAFGGGGGGGGFLACGAAARPLAAAPRAGALLGAGAPLRCEACDRDFGSARALRAHVATHSLCGVDGCTFAAAGACVRACGATGADQPPPRPGDQVRRRRPGTGFLRACSGVEGCGSARPCVHPRWSPPGDAMALVRTNAKGLTYVQGCRK